MSKIDLDPTNPQTELDKLMRERDAILAKIENPLARLATRVAGAFNIGELAESNWQITYARKKIVK